MGRKKIIDIAAEYPAGLTGKVKSSNYEPRQGFTSHSYKGLCESCGQDKKDHPICQACGALVGDQKHWQAPCVFREHTLCGSCVRRWKKLDSILRWAEGRDATWTEMLLGIHPSVALKDEEKKTVKVSPPVVSPEKQRTQEKQDIRAHLSYQKIRDTVLSVQTANALFRNGIETIGELCQKTPEELLNLRWIGFTKVVEIKEFLSKNGLRLR